MAFLEKVGGLFTNRAVRPFLTFFITVVYNVVLMSALFMDKLVINDYIIAVGPTNAMIIGFWFAEKAALKDPTNSEGR